MLFIPVKLTPSFRTMLTPLFLIVAKGDLKELW